MADVSPAEQAVKHESFNDADSPPTSPPSPETATEEALPEMKAEVKEEVEDPAPKVVRINRNAYGFMHVCAGYMCAAPIPFFHSSFRQREGEDGMKVSKTGCSTLGNVACALLSIKLASSSFFYMCVWFL